MNNALFQGGKSSFLSRTDFVLLKLVKELKEKKCIYSFNEERLSNIGFEGKFPLGRYPQYNRRVEIEITDIKE